MNGNLRKRMKTVENIICHLKERQLISEHADDSLLVFIILLKMFVIINNLKILQIFSPEDCNNYEI